MAFVSPEKVREEDDFEEEVVIPQKEKRKATQVKFESKYLEYGAEIIQEMSEELEESKLSRSSGA